MCFLKRCRVKLVSPAINRRLHFGTLACYTTSAAACSCSPTRTSILSDVRKPEHESRCPRIILQQHFKEVVCSLELQGAILVPNHVSRRKSCYKKVAKKKEEEEENEEKWRRKNKKQTNEGRKFTNWKVVEKHLCSCKILSYIEFV